MRIFPLSNWTELDVWSYILHENIELPSMYFSHQRECVVYQEKIWAMSKYLNFPKDAQIKTLKVRCRTMGDLITTGFILSEASSVMEIIEEIKTLSLSERGLRFDDQFSETSMEDRKKEGYF